VLGGLLQLFYKNARNKDLLENYAQNLSAGRSKVHRFSWWMTSMCAKIGFIPHNEIPFDICRRHLPQLDYVHQALWGQLSAKLAENYVVLPMEWVIFNYPTQRKRPAVA